MRLPSSLQVAALMLAAICGAFAQDHSSKITPEVRSAAKAGGRIPVFILLNSQPHRQIVAEVDNFYRADRESAHAEYQQAASGSGDTGRVMRARRRLDDVLLRSRKDAFDRIAFQLRPQREAMTAYLGSLGAMRVRGYQAVNLLRADVPVTALATLETHTEIVRVFAIGTHRTQLNVSVPATGAPAMRSAGFTGAGETVGVMDTGITPHPALPAARVSSAGPFLTSGMTQPGYADAGTTADQVGHGTLVAGVILSAGSANCANCLGMTNGAGSVLNLKTGYRVVSGSSFTGGFQEDDLLDALDWALQQRPEVKIFNFSAGHQASATVDTDALSDLFDFFADVYGVTIVVSAGNDGRVTGAPPNQLSSPGIGYNVITVANADATGATPVHAVTSSLGPVTASQRSKPDIAAPGTRIASTSMDGKTFEQSDGSSIAAPHIAGAAALIRSGGVSDAMALKALLLNSAVGTAGWKNDFGWGFVNLTPVAALLTTAKQTGRQPTFNGYLQLSSANAFQLIHVKASAVLKATLTWNRHFDNNLSPVFNHLNVSAYQLKTNQNAVADSTGAPAVDNVKQLSGVAPGDLVLKVKANNGALAAGTVEPFAVATSEAGATALNGPILGLTCQVQSSNQKVATVPVNCTATISGDAPISNVTGVSDDGQSLAFGNMDPTVAATQLVVRTMHANTPSGDPVTHTVTMTGQAFGETFTTTATFTVYASDGDGSGGSGGTSGSCKQGANVSLNPTNLVLGVGANGGSFGVSAPAGCKWIAESYAGPVQVINGASGSGAGSVSFEIVPFMPGPGAPTTAAILVIFDFGEFAPPSYRQRAVTIQFTPSTCSFTVANSLSIAASAPAGMVSGSIPVTQQGTASGCGWAAYSSTDWITFTTSSGTGSGAAVLVAKNNPSSKPRSGPVSVANTLVTVTQPGVACTYTLTPTASNPITSSTALGGAFTVTTPDDCAWTPVPSSPHIKILNVTYTGPTASTKSGNGVVYFGVGQNFASTAARGTISVNGAVYNVVQRGVTCVTGFSPSRIDVDAGGGAGVISVVAPAGCAWAMPATPAWVVLKLKPGAPMSGSQVLTYTVAADKGAARSFTSGGLTINQAEFSVASKPINVSANATNTTIIIDGPANLSLVAAPAKSGGVVVNWVHVNSISANGGGKRYSIDVAIDRNGTPGSRSTVVYVFVQNEDAVIPVSIVQAEP